MKELNLIKELRDSTQAGMNDCKKALIEAAWDLNKAKELIIARGLKVSADRDTKLACEGFVFVEKRNGSVLLFEANCQTDFVAKSDLFKQFIKDVADNMFNGVDFSNNEKLKTDLSLKTGEKISIRNIFVTKDDKETHNYIYSHSGKIGVVVTLSTKYTNSHIDSMGKNLAMQVAAMNPLAISPDKLDLKTISSQETIFKTQLLEANKPEKSWEKIIAGKFNKWYTDVCLLEQESIHFPKESIKSLFLSMNSNYSDNIVSINNFIRVAVGDGLTKKEENLAEEVSRMLK